MKDQISDYTFVAYPNQQVKLMDLFGDKSELIVIHNMGKKCPYCTMWADGFNGVAGHLEDRAPFVVISPDSAAIQHEFAASRNWKFKMVSAAENNFVSDMGFGSNDDPQPGVSVFVKENGSIYRVAKDEFGPGDKYSPVFNLFELLPNGPGKWAPKYSYKK